MKQRLMLWCGWAMCVAILAVGCQTRDVPQPSASMTDAIWQLVELRGVPAVAKDYPRHPTLRFHASTQRVSGYSGVNTFGGVYELTGAKLKLRLLMSTMMAGPEELMTLEQRYNATLGEVDGWRLTPAGLELSKGDDVVARFRPLPAAIGTAN